MLSYTLLKDTVCPYSSVSLGLHSQVCSISKHKMSVDEGQQVMSDFQGKLTVSKIKLPQSMIDSPKGTFSINYNAYLRRDTIGE